MEQQEKNDILQVKNLHVHYITDEEEVYAVNGISFELKEGDSIGLVGETGAGKTTTAMAIMQLVPDPPGVITEGEIYFKGKNLIMNSDKENEKIRGNGISMIFQDPMTALNPTMTIGDQLIEVLLRHNKITKAEAKKRCIEMLEMVGVKAERFDDYPHQFSGGMKQRVVITMALLCNPDLLIADEPTTALDVTIEAQILHLMKQLQEEKKTAVMMITHNLGVVAQFCTRLYVMYAGKVMESGTVKEIFKHVCHPYTDGLMRSVPDMESKERLYNIRGMVPSMLHLPKGCRFCPRCQYSGPKCFEKEPELYQVSPGHFVRCFLFENSAEGGGTDEAQVKETMIQEREDG